MPPKKILIIEDDAFLSSLVSEKLAESGFAVDSAATGADGIAKAHQDGVRLVLLDLMLPDMGGFEILATLKGDTATKDIPVIILSNLGGREEIEKGLKMGAVTYLIKSNVLPHEVAEIVMERTKDAPASTPPTA